LLLQPLLRLPASDHKMIVLALRSNVPKGWRLREPSQRRGHCVRIQSSGEWLKLGRVAAFAAGNDEQAVIVGRTGAMLI
jgi:hypothetical protein